MLRRPRQSRGSAVHLVGVKLFAPHPLLGDLVLKSLFRRLCLARLPGQLLPQLFDLPTTRNATVGGGGSREDLQHPTSTAFARRNQH